MQTDLLAIIMALITVALLLLYCMRRKRGGSKDETSSSSTASRLTPVSAPAPASSANGPDAVDENDAMIQKKASAPTNTAPVPVEEEPLIQKETMTVSHALPTSAAPPPRRETGKKEGKGEDEEEAPLVTEEMVQATRQKMMLAQTERTQSLYALFEAQDVQEVAKEVTSLDEVSSLINQAGVERCNLIFGIDYTGSNYLQGKKTFGGKCLHNISDKIKNPYQNVISFLGETLEPFQSDGTIPAFGFGDAYTKDHSVFSLMKDGDPANFHEVLKIYNTLTPKVRLGGPTNFAPLIKRAIEIVQTTRCYNILVIVADGQVTNEKATTEAIVEASNYPLSIITVGVGDGPWETMHDFDEKLPVRNFDNFHFVDYTKVTKDADNPSTAFALQALLEIPEQYKAIKRLQLLYN